MRDLIDRQQAIDEIMSLIEEPDDDFNEGVRTSASVIYQLPSAQPNVYVSTKDADCISRSQALNAIHVGGDLEGAWINVAKLPSAQLEIIRCKECKYYTTLNAKCEIRGKGLYLIRGMNDFCSRAERRSDE